MLCICGQNLPTSMKAGCAVRVFAGAKGWTGGRRDVATIRLEFVGKRGEFFHRDGISGESKMGHICRALSRAVDVWCEA